MRILFMLICTFSLSALGCVEKELNNADYNLRIMDGYIVKDKLNPDLIYLQDMESARLIELKFLNDDFRDLEFDDFGAVEVIGKYNTKYNFLIVDQILDTRELLVLDPIMSENI